MSDFVVIVSLAPWARKGLWWRTATTALRLGMLERPPEVLMRYFQASPANDCGMIAMNEVPGLRGWATNVAGWRERAARGQHPLRFDGFDVQGARIDVPVMAR